MKNEINRKTISALYEAMSLLSAPDMDSLDFDNPFLVKDVLRGLSEITGALEDRYHQALQEEMEVKREPQTDLSLNPLPLR